MIAAFRGINYHLSVLRTNVSIHSSDDDRNFHIRCTRCDTIWSTRIPVEDLRDAYDRGVPNRPAGLTLIDRVPRARDLAKEADEHICLPKSVRDQLNPHAPEHERLEALSGIIASQAIEAGA